jgi:hypothetical protein
MTKDQILGEIRRTAELNGGIPLGWRRFIKETAILPYDIEKHWSLWSEAQKEAGFTPNTRNQRFDQKQLYQKITAVVRELGKFPTVRELKLRSHNDPSFPNEKTIRRSLGTSMEEWIPKLLAYCEEQEGLNDLVPIFAARCGKHHQAKGTIARTETDEVLGFVYLIKSGRNYKIGKTNAVGRRERELAIQLPDKAATVHAISTDDPLGIESYWHRRFESKRKNGEWFSLDQADVRAFKRRKFM